MRMAGLDSWRFAAYGARRGIGLNGRTVTLMNDYVATNTQGTPSKDEPAWKMRRDWGSAHDS